MFNLLHQNKTMSAKNGFTMMEVLLTVSIITLLVSISGYSWMTLSNRAKAAKIVKDFNTIESAWLLWRADSRQYYLPDSDATFTQESVQCISAPFIDKISIISTYMNSVPRDSYGLRYDYDYDNDVLDQSGCTPGVNNDGYNVPGVANGVDIGLHMCPNDIPNYRKLVDIIDKSIDNGDGACKGKFRWQFTAVAGGLLYSMDRGN